MIQMFPYIHNINEDAQLSGVVKLFIREGPFVENSNNNNTILLITTTICFLFDRVLLR